MTLDHDDVEAIARRVAELVAPRARIGLVSTDAVADELGVSSGWVYEHAEQLGVIRLPGAGAKPRLRFDLERVRAAVIEGERPAPERPRRRGRPKKNALPADVTLIQGRGTG